MELINRKILITGKPASGKSIYSRYLQRKIKKIGICSRLDFEDYRDKESLLNAIDSLPTDTNLIVVVQHESIVSHFIPLDFFDHHYVCSRPSRSSFSVTDGLLVQEFSFSSMKQYFDSRLDNLFTN